MNSKMRTKLTSFLFIFLVLITSCPQFLSAKAAPLIQDEAGLLSASEQEQIASKIEELQQAYPDYYFAAYTVEGHQNRQSQDFEGYAREIALYYGLDPNTDFNGVLLLIDIFGSEYHVRAFGDATEELSEGRRETILDEMWPHMSTQEFGQAFLSGFTQVDQEIKLARIMVKVLFALKVLAVLATFLITYFSVRSWRIKKTKKEYSQSYARQAYDVERLAFINYANFADNTLDVRHNRIYSPLPRNTGSGSAGGRGGSGFGSSSRRSSGSSRKF